LVDHAQVLTQFLNDWILAFKIFFLEYGLMQSRIVWGVITRANVTHRFLFFIKYLNS